MTTQHPLKEVFFLVIFGLGLGLGFNSLHTKPLPWIGKAIETVSLDDLEGSVKPPGDQTSDGHSAPLESGPGIPETGDDQDSGTADATRGGTDQIQNHPDLGNTPPPSENLYQDLPESEFPIEVSLAKAKELFDRGGLLVLDAREAEEFAVGHIKGAISAPAEHITGDVDWMDKTAADRRPILVYCGGGDCELSLTLGFELAKTGHRKVLIYEEGFPAWEQAGYPVGTGEMP